MKVLLKVQRIKSKNILSKIAGGIKKFVNHEYY